MRFTLALLALLAPALSAEPTALATEARFWLRADPASPPLDQVALSPGSVTHPSGETDPETRERWSDGTFPVSWWRWTKAALRFTPRQDGEVELVLLGPWVRPPGADRHARAEVLWDGLSAEGAELANGGFEKRRDDGTPAGWHGESPPDAWPTAGVEAREGEAVAATWHDRALRQRLRVTKDQPVTLTFHARAATPPGFVVPARLGRETPAHEVAAKLGPGVNLGNCWEVPPPYQWRVPHSVEDVDKIAAEGFAHIRVPVAWHHHLREEGGGPVISPDLLGQIEPVIRRALEKDLHVLLNWHHFDDLTDDPAAHRERFVAGWETIARHFRDWPGELLLELLNEPRDALTTERANGIHAEAIDAIRGIDPDRVLLVSPGNWGDIRELDALRLPDDDPRLIVTVHCYEPFFFTHQGANWVQLTGLRGIVYPGPPAELVELPESVRGRDGVAEFIEAYNTLPAERNPCSPRPVRELLDLARAWSDHFGRPVHLGEFGAHRVADAASRARYTRDVRRLAEERSIPWALWDWKAGFAYWDRHADKPLLREAAFGE